MDWSHRCRHTFWMRDALWRVLQYNKRKRNRRANETEILKLFPSRFVSRFSAIWHFLILPRPNCSFTASRTFFGIFLIQIVSNFIDFFVAIFLWNTPPKRLKRPQRWNIFRFQHFVGDFFIWIFTSLTQCQVNAFINPIVSRGKQPLFLHLILSRISGDERWCWILCMAMWCIMGDTEMEYVRYTINGFEMVFSLMWFMKIVTHNDGWLDAVSERFLISYFRLNLLENCECIEFIRKWNEMICLSPSISHSDSALQMIFSPKPKFDLLISVQ